MPAGAHVELADVDVEGLSKEELLLELKKVISDVLQHANMLGHCDLAYILYAG